MEKKCQIQSKIYEKKTSHQNQPYIFEANQFHLIEWFLQDEETLLME